MNPESDPASELPPYYPEEFVIHEIPSNYLESYMRGDGVISSTTHETIRRPGGLYLKQMQHERHELDRLSLYRVRLVWGKR